MRKRKTIPKTGTDSNGAEDCRPAHQEQQGAVAEPVLSQQMDEATVKFGDMVKAMQYLTDEVTNLRYQLLQYQTKCLKNQSKRKSNS
jgi:hypothetical protein